MPIIEDKGTTWIDVLVAPVFSPQDGAGPDNMPLINLSRPGTFLAGTVVFITGSAAQTNAQAIAYIQLLDQNSSVLVFGESITGIVPRVVKQAGTGGAGIQILITLYMRKNL